MTGHVQTPTGGTAGPAHHPLLPADCDVLRDMLGWRVRDLRVEVCEGGRGRTDSYHAKQLAQHAAMAVTDLPLVANRIEVACLGRASSRPGGAEFSERADGRPPRRVLLATGDSRLLSAGRDHLTERGCVVATAAGGVECVARLREFAPDVVVLDTDLLWGGADGVLARLRAAGDAKVPVVLLASPSDVLPWLVGRVADPVAAEIEKPVAMDTLWRAVRSAAGEAAAGPEA